MALFGKLFEKKICDFCGEEISLLGNKKLEDGNMCGKCAKKLSPWFDDRRHSTVEQIRAQLEYREANKAAAAAFRVSETYGKSGRKLLVDGDANKFTVTSATDLAADNPDILDFSQITSVDIDIDEDEDEVKKTVNGETVSYDPPRYEYSYDFRVTIKVDHPYFDEMRFDLNPFSVKTGQRSMVKLAEAGKSLTAEDMIARSVKEYTEYVELGEAIKKTVEEHKNRRKPSAGKIEFDPEAQMKNMEEIMRRMENEVFPAARAEAGITEEQANTFALALNNYTQAANGTAPQSAFMEQAAADAGISAAAAVTYMEAMQKYSNEIFGNGSSAGTAAPKTVTCQYCGSSTEMTADGKCRFCGGDLK